MKSPKLAACVAFATMLGCGAMPASAQGWTERPYDPPVGSRWHIESQTDTQQSGDIGAPSEFHMHSVSEFTVTEKVPGGFREVFVNRGIKISGTSPSNSFVEKAFTATKDIEVRARTDRSGKPVEVENVDEVKATMRTVVDRLTANFADQPKVVEVLKGLLEGFLRADSTTATGVYIDEVPLITAAQSTGLRPGTVLSQPRDVEAPLGGGSIKGVIVMRLSAWDDKAGTARYTRTLEIDNESVRAFILSVTQKLAATSDRVSPKMADMMKQISINMTSEATIDVEGGIARAATETEVTTASLMGHTMTRRKVRTVKVTPAS
jgi:hypothetical protein